MKTERLRNRAVIFFGQHAWVVQGLDRDICAQGKTIMDAVHSFERTVAGEVVIGNYTNVGQPPKQIQDVPSWPLGIRPYAGFTTEDGYIGMETEYRLADSLPLTS